MRKGDRHGRLLSQREDLRPRGGSSAASEVAYRAGERIDDQRTGKTYDHSDRRDVMHKEIVLPSRFADEDIAWARDRASL